MSKTHTPGNYPYKKKDINAFGCNECLPNLTIEQSKTLEEILTMYPLQYFSKEERKEIEVLVKIAFDSGNLEGRIYKQNEVDYHFQQGKEKREEEIIKVLMSVYKKDPDLINEILNKL